MSFVTPDKWSPNDGIQRDQDSLDGVRSHVSQAVQAGPSAGKTELLAQRAAFQTQTNTRIAPRKIVAIDFKRDAAINLKERVAKRVWPECSERFDSNTFDAFAKGILDRFPEGSPEWVPPKRDYDIPLLNSRISKDFGDQPNMEEPFHREMFSQKEFEKGHAYLGGAPSPFPMRGPSPRSRIDAMALGWWDSQRIVDIVNSMAMATEPVSITVNCSKTVDPIPIISDGIVAFSIDDDERKGLAKFIFREIENGSLNTNDFIILVRQNADDYENDGLMPTFEKEG